MLSRPFVCAVALALSAPGVVRAQQCVEDPAEPIATVGSAVDSALASDGFAREFLAAFAGGAHASESGIASMKTALSHERGDARDAAEKLFNLVKNDGELSECEIGAAGRSLSDLGVDPAAGSRVLSHPAPPSNVGIAHVDLDLDLSKKGAASFPAHATIALDSPAPATAILEADPDRLTVTSVQAAGHDVPFEMRDGRLVVHAAGAKSFDIRYDLKPTNARNGHGLIRDPQTGRMWTMLWPYYGGSLVPSNSAPSDGSTATLTVHAPAGFEAIASGQQEGTSSTFSSAAETPIYANAVYLAPDYIHGDAGTSAGGVHVSGVGIGHYASEETRAAYRAVAKDALDFYSGWLGPYEYGDTLKTVELASDGVGGMEHVSAVAIMTGSARDHEYSKQTAAHEVAHHWFGDNLRISGWNDFWMSEGFTEYSEYRYFRHAQGEEKYRELLRESKTSVRNQLADGAHALHPGACTDVNDIFDDVPYEQGAWMLRMLESKMGTPAFDAMLKDWYRQHRFEPVSTGAFVAFASQKAGKDLQPWFDAWSDLKAVPKLESRVSTHGRKVSATLTAKNAMPSGIAIPLVLTGANGESKTVMVKPGHAVKIDAGFVVAKTEWDPAVTVLADVRAARGES